MVLWLLHQSKGADTEEIPEAIQELQELGQGSSTEAIIPDPTPGGFSGNARPDYDNAEVIRKKQADAEAERKKRIAEAEEAERKRLQAEAEEAERKRLQAEAEEAERKRLQAEAEEAERKRLQQIAEAQEAERRRLQAEAEEAERKRLQQIAEAEAVKARARQYRISVRNSFLSNMKSGLRNFVGLQRNRILITTPPVMKQRVSIQAGYLAGGALGGQIGRAILNLTNAQRNDAERYNTNAMREASRDFPIQMSASLLPLTTLIEAITWFQDNADYDFTKCSKCGLVVRVEDVEKDSLCLVGETHEYENRIIVATKSQYKKPSFVRSPELTDFQADWIQANYNGNITPVSSTNMFRVCNRCDGLVDPQNGASRCADEMTHELKEQPFYLFSGVFQGFNILAYDEFNICAICSGVHQQGRCVSGIAHNDSYSVIAPSVLFDLPANWAEPIVMKYFSAHQSLCDIWSNARNQWGWWWDDVKFHNRNTALQFFDEWMDALRSVIYDIRIAMWSLLRDSPFDVNLPDYYLRHNQRVSLQLRGSETVAVANQMISDTESRKAQAPREMKSWF